MSVRQVAGDVAMIAGAVPGPTGLGRVSGRVPDGESEKDAAQPVRRDRLECEQVWYLSCELVEPGEGGFKVCNRRSVTKDRSCSC